MVTSFLPPTLTHSQKEVWWWSRRWKGHSSCYRTLQWDIICFRDTGPSNSEAITLGAQRSENRRRRDRSEPAGSAYRRARKPRNSWGNQHHFSQKSREFREERESKGHELEFYFTDLSIRDFQAEQGEVRRVWLNSNNLETQRCNSEIVLYLLH